MKTFVRIDLDTKTLDEIDRRAIAANMSRSDYVAMLVEQSAKHAHELEQEYLRGYDNGYAACERLDD